MASSGRVKDLFKQQTLKQSKLTQLNRMFYEWFTAMCSEGKPGTRPMRIEKAKPLCSTQWRSWLRHYTTSQKVMGLIPDGVIGIFH
jgi:hypothetical protein